MNCTDPDLDKDKKFYFVNIVMDGLKCQSTSTWKVLRKIQLENLDKMLVSYLYHRQRKQGNSQGRTCPKLRYEVIQSQSQLKPYQEMDDNDLLKQLVKNDAGWAWDGGMDINGRKLA